MKTQDHDESEDESTSRDVKMGGKDVDIADAKKSVWNSSLKPVKSSIKVASPSAASSSGPVKKKLLRIKSHETKDLRSVT